MDRERVGVHRRGCKPDLALRRRVIGLIWMLTFGGMQWRIAGLLSGIPFTTLHTSFARWSRLGCGAGWASVWPSTGASPAATRSCPRRWWSTAARSAPPRAPGREGSTAASWSRASSSSPPATSTVRCSISSCIRPTRMTGRASCRRCRGWPRSASRVICSATAASRARLRRRGARARHPRRGLARRHAGGALPAERHPLGRGAVVRLAEPLSPPQHRP